MKLFVDLLLVATNSFFFITLKDVEKARDSYPVCCFTYTESKAVPLCCVGMKGERRCSSNSFLTSALPGVSGCHALAAHCPRGSTPGTHLIGGWLGLRAGLDTKARGEILCLCWGSNPGCPVCSQTLCWLRGKRKVGLSCCKEIQHFMAKPLL
jgi:hypothetical protein